jgi:hypothetical protein
MRRGEMSRSLRVGAIVAALAIAFGVPAAVSAADNSRCWGVVTSQRAVALHDIGEHSSSFAGARRLGLANVARLVLGEGATLGDLGAALGSLDGIPETSCP